MDGWTGCVAVAVEAGKIRQFRYGRNFRPRRGASCRFRVRLAAEGVSVSPIVGIRSLVSPVEWPFFCCSCCRGGRSLALVPVAWLWCPNCSVRLVSAVRTPPLVDSGHCGYFPSSVDVPRPSHPSFCHGPAPPHHPPRDHLRAAIVAARVPMRSAKRAGGFPFGGSHKLVWFRVEGWPVC